MFKKAVCAKNFPLWSGYIRLDKHEKILKGDIIVKIGFPPDKENEYSDDVGMTPYKYKKNYGTSYYKYWWYRPIVLPRKLTGNAFFAKELPLP